MDYYKTEADYITAFQELVQKIPPDGFLVYNAEDKNCQSISDSCPGKTIPVHAADAKELNLKVPGSFNQLNAAHALQAAEQITQNLSEVRKGLESFSGTARRMEMKGEKKGILIVDDYGHHPTEIRLTLKSAQRSPPSAPA